MSLGLDVKELPYFEVFDFQWPSVSSNGIENQNLKISDVNSIKKASLSSSVDCQRCLSREAKPK